ncbi:metallophosphoesterase family protein [Catellatospora methionotrophica]|uniref:metallophosphoesterase family protein n=1 Tax=Catellatospora methionotrophica TaxID=121620 RepID=UPI00140B8F6E|nr:metallophosphoesterase [Catellatospora methionotrophica]
MERRYVARAGFVAGLLLAAVLTSATFAPDPAAEPEGRSGGRGDGGGYGPTPPPTSPPPSAPPQEAWAWTQLIPGGTQVRVATPAATCPILVVTTGTQVVRHQMVLESTVALYPTTATVCTRRVAGTATAARIDVATSPVPVRPDAGGAVPLPNWTQPGSATRRPANIALIGDTGCRIPAAGTPQACTPQPQDWPFRRVANSAAANPVPPNLVVHLGDYIYRSRPGPTPSPLCGGPGTSPSMHTWGCLVADFFQPAARLLAQAPFVFVRGNHETCGRSGEVWFRYLATTPSTTACGGPNPQDFSPPVRVAAGTLDLLLMDTSCASDESVPPSCAQAQRPARYTAQFNEVNSSLVQAGENFLLSHTPIWAVRGQTPAGNPVWIDEILSSAVAATSLGILDRRIDLVLAGHIHLYQMLTFDTSTQFHRPPVVTVGASGTELDPKTWQDSDLVGKPVDGVAIGDLVTRSEFGYGVLRDTGTTWNLRFFNQFGTRVPGTNCNLVGARFPNCG